MKSKSNMLSFLALRTFASSSENTEISLFISVYSITLFGSLLGMIAVFNSVNMHFRSNWALPAALALRTVFMFFSGKLGPYIFSKLSIKSSLRVSEFSGIIGVITILFSYEYNLLYLAIFGVSFLGLPGGLLAQGLVSMAKLNLEGQDFRLLTRRLSLITGIIFIIAGVVTPILLDKFNVKNLFYMDLITYFISIVLLTFIKKDKISEVNKKKSIDARLNFSKFEIAIKLTPALLFMGFLPLIAGHQEIQQSISSSNYFILKSGWAFEGVGMIIAGLLYKFESYREKLSFFFGLSSLPLLINQAFDLNIILVFSMIILGTSYAFCFMKIRDDYLIRNESEKGEIFKITGYFIQVKSLFYILSPLYLMKLYEKFGMLGLLILGAILQVAILIYEKKKTQSF